MLVTGASGFIGGHLRAELGRRGFEVVTLARDQLDGPCLDLTADSSKENWVDALQGIAAVIHLAGVAHRQATQDEYERINVAWPVKLQRAAAQADVQSLVIMSSIKVLGDASRQPFRESDGYREDDDPYGLSKIRMEQTLLAEETVGAGPTCAVVRTPLVYGPGVKANFLALLSWADRASRGLPLPFGRATAPRSFIGVRNLCDLLIASIGHHGIVHGADLQDLSLRELLLQLGVAPGRLLPVPPVLLRSLLAAVGRRSLYERLFGPLQLAQAESNARLGWTPPHGSAEQLEETLAWYRSRT